MVNGLVMVVHQDSTDSFNSIKHHPISNKVYLDLLDLDFYLDTHQKVLVEICLIFSIMIHALSP